LKREQIVACELEFAFVRSVEPSVFDVLKRFAIDRCKLDRKRVEKSQINDRL
jgi:hypothetical protein